MAFAEGPSVARMVFFNAKPGSKAPLEEVIMKEMALRREEKDPWRWLTWEYVSGEVPRYCVATFGHAWEEFDQTTAAGRSEESIGAGAAALSSNPPVVQYFEHLDEVSEFGTQTNTPTLAEISVFQLHYGKTAQFYTAVRGFHDALGRGARSTATSGSNCVAAATRRSSCSWCPAPTGRPSTRRRASSGPS